jgi:hypothetical protein
MGREIYDGGDSGSQRLGTAQRLDPREAVAKLSFPLDAPSKQIWIGEALDERGTPLGYDDDRHVCLTAPRGCGADSSLSLGGFPRLFVSRHFANDEQRRVLVLGAIPMHALGEMRDEGAGLHRHREVGGVEGVAGAHPPGARQHHDEAIVRMRMRAAEIALGPCQRRRA